MLGLYHFTTQTSEVPETNSPVDIGYHYVAVDDFGQPIDLNNNGIYDYLENPNGPVALIVGQPASETVAVGDTAVFTVTASGSAPLSYQWYFNSSLLSGGTNATLNLTNAQLTQAGNYWMVLSNPGGATTSSVAVLTVLSPSVVSGLRLWLNGDAGVTHDSSGLVSVWADQSGNTNNATQSNGSQQPTIVSNAINAHPVIHFNGSSAYLQLPDVMPSTTVTQGEAFAIVKATLDPAASDYKGLWSFGNVSGSAGGRESYPDSQGSIKDSFGSQSMRLVGLPAQPLTTYHEYDVSSATNDWEARINGVLICATNQNAVAFPSAPSLGESANAKFAGDIAEILVFNHVLTATERDAIGYYFNARYGLVQAPATPTNLTALAISSNQVSLVWNAVLTSTNINFKVERSAGNPYFFAPIALVRQGASYIDTGLSPGTTYYYRVKASNFGGDSGYSNTGSATPLSGQASFPLTSLVSWLKADAGHTGSKICFWADQSGSSNNAGQFYEGPNSGNIYPWCPTVLTNSINGRPAVHFNGTNSQLLLLQGVMQNLAASEAVAVVCAISNINNLKLWEFGTSIGDFYPTSSGTVQDGFGSTVPQNVGQPSSSVYVPHIYDVYSRPGDWAARINGVVQYETNQTEVSFPNQPEIGGGSDNADFYGEVAEVLVFNRVLAETERNAVGIYLAGKYGITNSPPPSPTNFVATGLSPIQISLHAAGAQTNTGSLIIERKLGSTGNYSQLGVLANPAASAFVDTVASSTAQYYYRLTAYNYAGLSSPVVIAPPTALINTPASATPLDLGTNFVITTTASDPDGSIAKVDLYNASNLLATLTSGPFTFTNSTTNAVYFGLTIKATDNQGNTRISSLVNLPVYTNTSGDGRNDGLDIYLGLDPTNTSNVPFNPSDVTPPIIHLLQPTNATWVP